MAKLPNSRNGWIPAVEDFSSGIVVFLIALPLCLGIAIASGVPPVAGIISGIIGGVIVGLLSGSSLSVSGPAAGLTAVVLQANESLNSFELLLTAVFLAGVIQIVLAFLKMGAIGHYIPSSVILGMLAAIGLILIMKQFPHAIGYDLDPEGDESFIQSDGHNTFSEIYYSIVNISWGALIISSFSILLLFKWEKWKKHFRIFTLLPGPLVVVMIGVLINYFFLKFLPSFASTGIQLVHLPDANDGIFSSLAHPDFSAVFTNDMVWKVAFIIAIVASIESLLSLEASDRLDPRKKISPPNQELFAQGAGNIVAGLVGGLPVTTVIVRSSVNISAGARTRWSAVFHGLLLFVCVITIPGLLNMIPKSALAAILLFVGYKLTPIKLFRQQWKKGKEQFLPFLITISAILLTNLLIGILIGIVAGIFFVLRSNFHAAVFLENSGSNYLLKLNKDVSFLNKPLIRKNLRSIPDNSYLIIDGSKAFFIDPDIMDEIEEFIHLSKRKNITVQTRNLTLSETIRPPASREQSMGKLEKTV
jgi:MFS superfamily sulfate permease-like transporter